MFSNLQIRPAKPHRRKPSMAARGGITKRRVSHVPATAADVPSLSFMEGLFGDEFPEAFAGTSDQAMRSRKSISDLPAELLAIVSEDLSKLDIKRLRLASKYLAKSVDLRINRIYVSPNRANLDCLQKILDHPRYKYQVREIVWDDAQLDEYLDLESFRHAIHIDETSTKRDIENLLEEYNIISEIENADHRPFEHDEFFAQDGRLTEVAKGILLRHNSQFARDVIAKNARMMSIEESWDSYKVLYQEEQEIMAQQLDVAALRQTLAACPNLTRMTLAIEVWRPWNFQPIYHTPFFRTLPPGFRKPSVWPWLSYRPQATPAQAAHRDKTLRTLIPEKTHSLPPECRGYSIIVSALIDMRMLDKRKPHISDFMIDAGMETTGISHQLFATWNADWVNTISLARLIPLTRLKLSINSYGADHETTNSYLRSGQLEAALRTMPLLEHFDFSPNCHARRDETSTTEGMFYWRDILPLALVQRLKTFALRNANMFLEDILDLIQAMLSVQHITLDNIAMESMLGLAATHFALFRGMWIHYEITKVPMTRPAFTVVEPINTGPGGRYRARLTLEEISCWVHGDDYHNGCPFKERYERQIKDGVGWIVDDRDQEFGMRATDWAKTTEGRRWAEDGRVEQ